MTQSKRYAAYYESLQDQRIAQSPPSPCTLPMQAYGPQPVVWASRSETRAVWAWISWPHRPAERIACRAVGWNDRVVVVEWDGPRGTQNTVVWRNAVTVRAVD